jgi:hypothetical protein
MRGVKSKRKAACQSRLRAAAAANRFQNLKKAFVKFLLTPHDHPAATCAEDHLAPHNFLRA